MKQIHNSYHTALYNPGEVRPWSKSKLVTVIHGADGFLSMVKMWGNRGMTQLSAVTRLSALHCNNKQRGSGHCSPSENA